MNLWRICAVMVSAGFLFIGSASGETWDVTDDWSDILNPNGVWSYNAAVGDPLTDHVENYWSEDPPQPAWAFNPESVPGAHLPCFFLSTDSTTGSGSDWPLGRVFIHPNDVWNSPPEYRYESANVAWTSPIEGEIVISGGIWEASPSLERDLDWEIWKNDSPLSIGTIHYDDPYSSDSMMLWTYGSGGEEAMTLFVDVGDEVRLEILWNTGSAFATFAGIDFHIEGAATGVAAFPDPPSVLVLEQNRPNPFNPVTVLRYGLPQSSAVRLAIYDASGRLVTVLLNGVVPAGFHEAVWNGSGDTGENVGSGVYFARLETRGEVYTQKMILVR